jgi:hypothetical protein
VAYHGELLDQCALLHLDLSTVKAVAVSGDGPNLCGHLLLAVGPFDKTTYFHIAEPYGRPRYMSADGYKRYLKESQKAELNTIYLSLPNPAGAQSYLCGMMAKKWLWGFVPNNCVAFVEEAVQAGGVEWSSWSNCPVVALTPPRHCANRQFFN